MRERARIVFLLFIHLLIYLFIIRHFSTLIGLTESC